MSRDMPGETLRNAVKPSERPGKKTTKGKKRESLAHVAQLNSAYHKHEFKTKLGESFSNKKGYNHESGATLYSDPFNCCVLPNFLKDDHFLECLKDELLDQIFIEKNNDLYKFQQTDDLKKISTPHARGLRKFLCEDMLDWLRDVTGIPLSNKVDITCSKYDYTDTLLCHDDELDDRRIAYILYLVPPWKASDGGTFDMFNMDEHYQPTDICRSLIPQWNNFVWFEVTEASHHQVSEVLTEDKSRLSVNGWFHGPAIKRPARHIETPLPLKPHGHIEQDMVYEWINEIYLDPEVQAQIQEKFENDSEIELQGFLKDNKYQALVKALKSENAEWHRRGPPNKRCYYKVKENSAPDIIQQCLTFMQSEAVFLILSNLTGLSLHALAPNRDSDSEVSDSGSYTELVSRDTRKQGSKKGTGSASKGTEVTSNSGSEGEEDKKVKPKKKRRRLNSRSSDGEKPSDNSEDAAGDESEESDKSPACRSEVRKWTHGNYSLVHDTDCEGSEFALDAMLFCSCKGWLEECGGYTSYIAKGEDEELLTVNPAENSLALIYRDKETLKFTKHLNCKINEMQNDKEFFDIALTYFE